MDQTIHIVHRLGGATIENLRLKKAEMLLDLPGFSVLIGGTPEDAVSAMRTAFPKTRKWQSDTMIVATANLSDIQAAGFDVVALPTATFANHGRVIHPSGVAGFNDESLEVLARAFIATEGY